MRVIASNLNGYSYIAKTRKHSTINRLKTNQVNISLKDKGVL